VKIVITSPGLVLEVLVTAGRGVERLPVVFDRKASDFTSELTA
jgi:hypothetical protein